MAPINSEYAGPEKIIEMKGRYLFPCSFHFYARPPQMVSGSGMVLTDSEGKKYLDFFAGVSVMNCGHCHPRVNQAAIEQIQTLQHTTSLYLTQPVVDLAEALAARLPGGLTRSFFCNSGSEANEGAMLLARLHTGRREFAALSGSLHGRTSLTSGATALPMWRTDPFSDEVPVHFAPDAAGLAGILEDRGEEIAALLVEPVQGNGGIRPLPEDFFSTLGPLLDEKGVLLIADEVQTGFGRTGKMFAMDHYPRVPDILTGAKGLGNGFPIGFFSSTPEIAASLNRPSASTLGGNPVSCRAALAVLEVLDQENLVENARDRGEQLLAGLAGLAERIPFLGEPRGLGLMAGVEVKAHRERSAPELTDIILENMKDRGFLIGKNGLNRNVLAFQPPLIVKDHEVEALLSALTGTLEELI